MKHTLERMVWSVLKHFPETRNSDITLTQQVWKSFYPQYLLEQNGKTYINIENLFNVPREDNIKRIRAKIQNVDRQWLPTDVKIFIKRIEMSEEWKEFLGYKTDFTRTFENVATKYFEEQKVKQLSL